MHTLVLSRKWYFINYFIFLIIAFLLQFNYTKSELFLCVNQYHNSFLDNFFFYYTHLGDGLFFVLIALLFLFVRFRYTVYALIIYLATSQVVQLLKRVFFPTEPRPKKYFEGIAQIHFVKDMDVHSFMSFPSGHTTTAFAIATFLVLINRNNMWTGFFCFALAFFVGYSRIYLAQHFFADVIAGSLIGVFITLMTYVMLERSKWTKKSWLDKRINVIK